MINKELFILSAEYKNPAKKGASFFTFRRLEC